MESWAATKIALNQCGGVKSPCPGPYPTAACPELNVGCRLDRELFTLPYAAADVDGAMGCDQENFTLVWR